MSISVSPVVLITGATSGVGYETARLLLAGGATIIVHGPTEASVDTAATRLADGGADPGRVDRAVADFARLDEVHAMAHDVLDRYRRIDVLVNNAAMAGPESRRLTADGNEATFQVNYLAPYLLTRLLAPTVGPLRLGRMVAVSSRLHLTANVNWSDPQRTKLYSPVAMYAQSKLCLTMLAADLPHRIPGITAVSVDPGIASTGLLGIYGRIGAPASEAATAVAQLCSADVGRSNGCYFEQGRVTRRHRLADNPTARGRMWHLGARLVGLEQSSAKAA